LPPAVNLNALFLFVSFDAVSIVLLLLFKI